MNSRTSSSTTARKAQARRPSSLHDCVRPGKNSVSSSRISLPMGVAAHLKPPLQVVISQRHFQCQRRCQRRRARVPRLPESASGAMLATHSQLHCRVVILRRRTCRRRCRRVIAQTRLPHLPCDATMGCAPNLGRQPSGSLWMHVSLQMLWRASNVVGWTGPF